VPANILVSAMLHSAAIHRRSPTVNDRRAAGASHDVRGSPVATRFPPLSIWAHLHDFCGWRTFGASFWGARLRVIPKMGGTLRTSQMILAREKPGGRRRGWPVTPGNWRTAASESIRRPGASFEGGLVVGSQAEMASAPRATMRRVGACSSTTALIRPRLRPGAAPCRYYWRMAGIPRP